MKRNLKELCLALLLGIFAPWVILSWRGEETPQQTLPVQTTLPESRTIPVYDDRGQTVSMELTEYLTGVVLCEMPADFEAQAKMAQAVVARTYALRTVEKGVKHPPGAVCMNSACCQGYESPEDYVGRGGTYDAVEQARSAVLATQGLVLTYDGALIDATYFSCSGGMTEDALAVWGSDVPYLQAVSSPGEEHAAHYTDTVSFTSEAFQQALGTELSGSANSWFGSVTYTEGGGIDTLEIGGTLYKGTTLRQLLGLRSTAFTVTATASSVVITTKGFGHRVGMSQYGADAMASTGSTYGEILLHYYPGTLIDKLSELG